jgi:hypothetical protein
MEARERERERKRDTSSVEYKEWAEEGDVGVGMCEDVKERAC